MFFEPDGMGLSYKMYDKQEAIELFCEFYSGKHSVPEEPEELEDMVENNLRTSWVRYQPTPRGILPGVDMAWMIKHQDGDRHKKIWHYDPQYESDNQ
jgi:hypothetical protein